jgi:superfamily II DNA or RNA helicase
LAFPFFYRPNRLASCILGMRKFGDLGNNMLHRTIHPLKEQAEKLCNADFELMPHQTFVKNFMSLQTPYNSLLLYHNLGTGKTCSAIGIAEEMRAYMKNVGFTKKIIIVASPNVQENFRFQLFDESKLTLENGVWNLNTCIGNALLEEINPTHLIGLTKDKVVSQIKTIINTYYLFMGYRELANYILKIIKVPDDVVSDPTAKKQLETSRIQSVFNNRLIVIDEVHNIRISADNDKTRAKTASLLMQVAKYAENMRLLLLSATPSYNSYTEIIWLANLLNRVDRRSIIENVSDVFDKHGQFKEGTEGKESGEELLRRKLTGYVSYVRGENPYTFPFRIYPQTFSPENTLSSPPSLQMNGEHIETPLQFLPVYMSTIGEYQAKCYRKIILDMYSTMNDSIYNLESDTRTSFPLKMPIEALNIVYPYMAEESLSESEEKHIDPQEMVGKKGLSNCMTHDAVLSPVPQRYNYEYKPEVLESYGRIFSKEEIQKYSHKIATICSCIRRSTGIVLVYSEYIDGGLVPMALALEEMGMKRTNATGTAKSLFKTPPENESSPHKYVMITGDAAFSQNNLEDIKMITKAGNKYGELVKVVLISRAAAEGLDFKNIRQVHILDPWYNMNRIEQIIGRAVRNLSHCHLPFEERNVEIYLHATRLDDEFADEEAADLYLYRYAEKKGVQIGRVNRLLKEIAVDCLLNIKQTNFTVEKLASLAKNQNVELRLSTDNKSVVYEIGDRPFTEQCDYMDNCSFTCRGNETSDEVSLETYNVQYMKLNFAAVQKRIRQLFRERSHYTRDQLVGGVNIVKSYPLEQIFYVLSYMIENKDEIIVDKYGRTGRLANKGTYYLFTPTEVIDEGATIYERSVPVEYKRDKLALEIPQQKITKESEEEEGGAVNVTSAEPNVSRIVSVRSYESILLEMRECLSYTVTPVKIETKDTNWYKHAGHVLDLLHTNQEIPQDVLVRYILFHFLDTSTIEDRLILVQRLYYDENRGVGGGGAGSELIGIEVIIKQYFDEKIIRRVYGGEEVIAILLVTGESWELYVQDKTTREWTPAKPTERSEFIRVGINKFIVLEVDMNYLIGFMSTFKQDMVFKTKNLREKRNNRGAKCDIWTKADILKRLAVIIDDENTYSLENTENILKPGVCVIMEIIMRYYSDKRHKGKAWFLSPEQALINKVTGLAGK